MAIKKKSEIAAAPAPVLKKKASQVEETGPAPTPDEEEGASPKEKVKKPKEEAKANEELTVLVSEYDENVEAAEKSFIALVEYVQENQLDRATVVATFMAARGCTYEAANTQYSKMKKILNNQEVLDDLKAGKITLKVAREKTKGEPKQKKEAKPEQKEAAFTNKLKAFVVAAKETGFSLDEIITSVKAELKSAGIK